MKLSAVSGFSRRSQYQDVDEENDDFEPLLKQNGCSDPKSAIPVAGGNTINLLVLKLDGTSFHISVPSGATVGEMKFILEKTVNELVMDKQGYCDIQWDQVWGHFCLCYMNQKLLDDRASLRAFGIQGEDQVAFVQHLPNEQELQPRKRSFLFFA